MFCQNCGKQLGEGNQFCPFCGAKSILEQKPEAQQEIVAEKEKKKRKKVLPFIIAAVLLIALGILIFSSSGSSSVTEQLIVLVQNGYLGNYDTVTIKEVLEYAKEDGEWNAGEAKNGEYYIVEYKKNDFIIQFSINGLDEEVFNVLGMQVQEAGIDLKAYDVKSYLDSIYQLYANAYPEKGLYIDTSTANDTLKGHKGPIREEKEDENGVPLKAESAKDLSVYVDYTEDELVNELGFEKNEYGIYPEETHMNFSFEDGKVYAIILNKPEDIGMSLFGVELQHSVKEAGDILESRGFVYEDAFEGIEPTEGSFLDATGVPTRLYIESATGCLYCICTDVKNNITSLMYLMETLETKESIYEDEQIGEKSEGTADNNDSNDSSWKTYYGSYKNGEHYAVINTYSDRDEPFVYFYDDDETYWYRGPLEYDGSYYTQPDEGMNGVGGGIVDIEFADDFSSVTFDGFVVGTYERIDETDLYLPE